MKYLFYFLICSFCVPCFLTAQTTIDVRFDTDQIDGLPGLHSFASAEYEGQWLFIGGRRDGLHSRYGGFGEDRANKQIFVVDAQTKELWKKSNTTLPDTLREQLQSASMEFCQFGDTLCFIGGYGQSATADDYITYPYLTFIDVPGLIEAVKEDQPLNPHFECIRDTFFAVTGGQLERMNDTFYLVGGHYFKGQYSANSGTNSTQRYTNSIRTFTLRRNNGKWSVGSKGEVIDEVNLHRRDYNLAPQYYGEDSVGITAFSGVFQPGLALLPYLNIVEITPGNHRSVPGFNQYLANYYCPKIPLYSKSDDQMHTLFFGGMSQYEVGENGELEQDNRIPFVKTVSRVSRSHDGEYEEVALDTELPFYTGTGAEFLMSQDIPTLSNGIVAFDQLPDGETLMGYIVGGIFTPEGEPNPFLNNQTGMTSSNNVVLEVYLQKDTSTVAEIPIEGHYQMDAIAFPNPAESNWNIEVNLPESGKVHLFLQDIEGRIVRQKESDQKSRGKQSFHISASEFDVGIYTLTINVAGKYVRKLKLVKVGN